MKNLQIIKQLRNQLLSSRSVYCSVPCNLLEVEYRGLIPVIQVRTPSGRPITEYAANLEYYIDEI